MDIEDYEIIRDPAYGYRRLEPIPGDEQLAEFYESRYYDLLRKGGRAPDIRRLMEGGQQAKKEREWTAATLYADIAHCLREYAPGRRVLDVGCGIGAFISFLKDEGFHAEGIEPATEAVEIARSSGLMVSQATLEEYARGCPQALDAITFVNVLEHVPDPVGVLREAVELLAPGGCVVVWSPNDFNDLQIAAYRKREGIRWWVAIPDHINYFDFSSLEALLERLGLDVVYTQADFPMELFLLMGDEYVGNPAMGGKCHGKRVDFELSISAELRRRIYRSFAEVEIGRHVLMVAEKVFNS